MKILYTNKGEVLYVINEADWPTFTHSTNEPLTVATIDDNDETIRQSRAYIYRNHHKRDADGQAPCYVDPKSNTLIIRDDWTESVQPTLAIRHLIPGI